MTSGQQGTLQLFRTQKQLDRPATTGGPGRDSAFRTSCSTRGRLHSGRASLGACARKIVGGLRLPGDETGDCFKFTQRSGGSLPRSWASGSATARQSTAIRAEGGRITGIATGQGVLTSDTYIVALGSYSPLLLKPHRHPGYRSTR